MFHPLYQQPPAKLSLVKYGTDGVGDFLELFTDIISVPLAVQWTCS